MLCGACLKSVVSKKEKLFEWMIHIHTHRKKTIKNILPNELYINTHNRSFYPLLFCPIILCTPVLILFPSRLFLSTPFQPCYPPLSPLILPLLHLSVLNFPLVFSSRSHFNSVIWIWGKSPAVPEIRPLSRRPAQVSVSLSLTHRHKNKSL